MKSSFFARFLLVLLPLSSPATANEADTTLPGAETRRPNILWIVSEDNNIQWVGCYGNPNADTPRIDALAREGFRYTHCFANTPVCAPQRCTWITGIHAISMGTQPMRSRYDIPHDRIRYYPDCLREAGYLSLNPNKTDYNLGGRDDREAWDKGEVDFARLKQQPFFVVVNLGDSHESRAHGPMEETQHDPDQVILAPYHPGLVSFIDMPKTWLALAGASIPDEMQGQIFLGPQADPPRKVHFAYRGRMDERIDNARAVA